MKFRKISLSIIFIISLVTLALDLFIFSSFICPLNSVYAIERQQIRDRANYWVEMEVPYSQTSYYDGYRTDCAGFVSYAWEVKFNNGQPRSLLTNDFPYFADKINKDELSTGDIMLEVNTHVVIFDKWDDHSRSYYWAFEMTNPRAMYRRIPYPYWPGYGNFEPYRYKLTADDPTPTPIPEPTIIPTNWMYVPIINFN